MRKDLRYKAIKVLIETGNITQFDQIFEEHMFPVTVLSQFIGTNYTRMTKYIRNPSLFTFGEASRLAGFFDVEDTVMHRLIYNNILANKTRKKHAVPRAKKSTKKN